MVSLSLQVVFFMYCLHVTIVFTFRGFFKRSFVERYLLAQTLFAASQVIIIYFGYNQEVSDPYRVVDWSMASLLLAMFLASNAYRLSVNLPIIKRRFIALFALFIVETFLTTIAPDMFDFHFSFSVFLFLIIGILTLIDHRKSKLKDGSAAFTMVVYVVMIMTYLLTLAGFLNYASLEIYLSISLLRVFLWFAFWVILLFRESQLLLNGSINGSLRVSDKELIMREIVERSPSNIVVTDKYANIIYVNQKYLEFSGYKEEEILGKNPRMFASGLTPRETYVDLWDTITKGKTWAGEFHNRSRNGEMYLEYAQIVPIFDINGDIQFYLATKQDVTSERKLRAQLEHLASYDDLTNVMKRNKFYESVALLREGSYTSHVFALLDIDHFKHINDNFGHNAGDLALKSVANIARALFNKGTAICRFGGDEFGIFIPNISKEAASEQLITFIDTVATEEIRLRDESTIRVGISIGATIVNGTEIFEDAFDRADKALYASKESSESRVHWL